MGHDEHGQAYPEPSYQCPVCGIHDSSAYLRCYAPDCPDGRDQRRAKAPDCYCDQMGERRQCDASGRCLMNPPEPVELPFWKRALMSAAVAIAFLLLLLWSHPGHSKDHGFDPSKKATQWFESLIRPDLPPNSCCSMADSYPVKSYRKNDDHTYTVWLLNGDAIVYPDGQRRDPWDITVPVTVPDTKVNGFNDQQNNPTNTGWLFFRPAIDSATEVGSVYCFVPYDSGS